VWVGKGELTWFGQFNPESPRTPMLVVDGGQAWVLGTKTEGRASHVVATNGANVELIGSISYQSWDVQPVNPPMLQITDSDVSATFRLHSRKAPFATIVKETIKVETRTLPNKNKGGYLPLYRSVADH